VSAPTVPGACDLDRADVMHNLVAVVVRTADARDTVVDALDDLGYRERTS
jgi:hypothetical protein